MLTLPLPLLAWLISMPEALWSIARVLAFAAGVWIAVQVAAFLETDSCLDAGGRLHSSTGYCEVTNGQRCVSPLARPRNYGLWTLVLSGAALPLWLLALGRHRRQA